MNPITFNEPLIRAVTSKLGDKECRELCGAPLFVHALNYRASREMLSAYRKQREEQGDEMCKLEMPYKSLRVSLNVEFEDGEKVPYRAFAHGRPNGTGYLFVWSPLRREEQRVRGADSLVTFIGIGVNMEHQRMRIVSEHFSNVRGKWMTPEDISKSALLNNHLETTMPSIETKMGILRDSAFQGYLIFSAFIHDAMAPTNHIAEVVPTRGEPRSVEWVKARTHYTLITHGHPANCATVKHGERVSVDAAKELTRMAHGRRAHYKTYRHERYRFARGSRRFVRACWVGPKEWKDEGGKQIYRILEPVAEAAVA